MSGGGSDTGGGRKERAGEEVEVGEEAITALSSLSQESQDKPSGEN